VNLSKGAIPKAIFSPYLGGNALSEI